ncbi:MAG: hypothetical protein PHE51_06495 [Eubacteriales bacterium]|nr:hypothetical protein [Eubacteriales bacterium]
MKKKPYSVPVKKLDSMHKFMPYMLGGRTLNEAVMKESVDLTAVNEYIAEKNRCNPKFKYTLFHVISAAIAKTVYHRPLMNRYIMGGKYYDRTDISLAFTVKKAFSDKADEAIAICKMNDDTSPIDQLREQIYKIVYSVRNENKNDGATDIMDTITAFPACIIKLIAGILKILDRHNMLPDSLVKEDPYHCSVFVSNLGSIKLHAEYHHLADWGTNSFFVVIGEKYKKVHINEDDSTEIREYLDLGITVDERIADGYYYAQTVKVLRKLLENPYILDKPIDFIPQDDNKNKEGKDTINDTVKCTMA